MAENKIGQPLSSDPDGVEEANGALFGALDGYLTKRKRASDEVKRILDSVLEEFKLPPCRIENFGSVVLGDVMSGKRKGIYGESMYFMEEDVTDEAVIKK